MKLNELLTTLHEMNSMPNVVTGLRFEDSITGETGLIQFIKEGGAFKVYIENAPEGEKDYIISFHSDFDVEKYPEKIIIKIEDLQPNKIKILTILNIMNMQILHEINEYLEI